MWLPCPAYDLQPLFDITNTYITHSRSGVFTNHDHVESCAGFWYPLLAFQEIESTLFFGRRHKTLQRSRASREWFLGCLLWHIWRSRWAEIYQPDFHFDPGSTAPLTRLFEDPPD
jgi:hypothetical protein